MNSLVAYFAKTASMMLSIGVLALRRHLVVTFAQVAEMAHKFGSMLAIVVDARAHIFKAAKYLFEV